MSDLKSLAHLVTGREVSICQKDIINKRADLLSRFRGTRVLVIGGAGSIGKATIFEIVKYEPAAIHVIDINENSLAEMVRELRALGSSCAVDELRTAPIDFGGKIFKRFLNTQGAYQFVYNFAAVKHVRSEKDICSVLHMFDTNVVKQRRLLEWIGSHSPNSEYFSVSTDKAANPVNLMGASKRIMEQVLFSKDLYEKPIRIVKSARFANVAFSDGSLLWSWRNRFEKRQPLPVPKDIRRYFVSLEEAGQICLLASAFVRHATIAIPVLNPEQELRLLTEMAAKYLFAKGYKAKEYSNLDDATHSIERDMQNGCYPLLITQPDTSGEKMYEQFVSEGEKVEDIGLLSLKEVVINSVNMNRLGELLGYLEQVILEPSIEVSKGDIVARIDSMLGGFAHNDTGKNLDDRL